MANEKIRAFAQRLNGVGLLLAAGVLCVCCSEGDTEVMSSNNLSGADTTAKYDSIYNAAYNLYVVEDFCVNRPFLVFIRENNTGSILFSACIKSLND